MSPWPGQDLDARRAWPGSSRILRRQLPQIRRMANAAAIDAPALGKAVLEELPAGTKTVAGAPGGLECGAVAPAAHARVEASEHRAKFVEMLGGSALKQDTIR